MQTAVVTQKERQRAWTRLALGFAQMFGAAFSVTLLIRSGVTKGALVAVAVSGLLTTISVLLFGARHLKEDRR